MVALTVGMVVLIPFPFSDLSKAKLRPAVVLAYAGKNDWILCQITSKEYSDTNSIELNNNCFKNGTLQRISYARPGKLFTANSSLISSKAGLLKKEFLRKIIKKVVDILYKDL